MVGVREPLLHHLTSKREIHHNSCESHDVFEKVMQYTLHTLASNKPEITHLPDSHSHIYYMQLQDKKLPRITHSKSLAHKLNKYSIHPKTLVTVTFFGSYIIKFDHKLILNYIYKLRIHKNSLKSPFQTYELSKPKCISIKLAKISHSNNLILNSLLFKTQIQPTNNKLIYQIAKFRSEEYLHDWIETNSTC